MHLPAAGLGLELTGKSLFSIDIVCLVLNVSARDSSVSPTGEPEGDASSQAEMTASSSQDDSVLPPGLAA